MSVSSTSVNNQAALMYVKQKALAAGQDSSGLGSQSTPSAAASPGIDPTSATQIASSFLAALTQFSAGQGFAATGSTDPTAASSASATPGAPDDIQSLLTELNQSLQGSSGEASSPQQATAADGSSGSAAAKPAHHHGGHHAHAAPPADAQTATASTDAATASAGDSASTDTTASLLSLG